MKKGIIVNAPINAVSWDETIQKISAWASQKQSKYVCICNVHSVITADSDPQFAEVIRNADMATPDGYPIAWVLRRIGFKNQQRINGPDLMWRYMSEAQKTGQSIFLYGNTDATLEKLIDVLRAKFPGIKIAGHISPPYREITEAEDAEIVHRINQSGAGTVWVSLGCPKQEKWMADHKDKVQAVMVGVGAAFDYHAGTIQRAPQWMQERGLEWAHRFASEPRRLWKRYLTTNSLFLWKVGRAIATRRLQRMPSPDATRRITGK